MENLKLVNASSRIKNFENQLIGPCF